MPVYKLLCEQCGHETKVLCKFDKKNQFECKYCNGFYMTKQFGTPAFQLKGRGFYINDYPKRKR